jgi:hypothetical protein
MVRILFIIGNFIIAGYYANEGIRPYLTGALSWDAGAIQLFMAFWFFVSCVGLYEKNVWIVSTSCIALSGLLIVDGFISGMQTWNAGFSARDHGEEASIPAFGLLGFVVLTEFIAIWFNRKS